MKRALLTASLFFVACQGWAADPFLVKQATSSVSTGTSLIADVPSPTNGDALVLNCLSNVSGRNLTPAPATTGCTWHEDNKHTCASPTTSHNWWHTDACTFTALEHGTTVQWAASGFIFCKISEWNPGNAGNFTLDVSTGSCDSSLATSSSPTISPTAGQTEVFFADLRRGGTFSAGPFNGFTGLTTENNGFMASYKIVSATSGVDFTSWTYTTAATAGTAAISLKAPAAAGGSTSNAFWFGGD